MEDIKMKYNIEVTKAELARIINGLECYISDYDNGRDDPSITKSKALVVKLRKLTKPKAKAKPGPATPRQYGKSTLAAAQDVSNLIGKNLLELYTRLGLMDGALAVAEETVEQIRDRLDKQFAETAANAPEEDTGPHIGYICFDCAQAMGAKWPEHHCATCHQGVCPECMLKKSLASVDDWDWPKGTNRPKYGAGRD